MKIGRVSVLIRKRRDEFLFALLSYPLLALLSVACLLPIVIIVASSLTSEAAIVKYGYNLIPKEFSLEAYRLILENPQEIRRAYFISLFVTATGGGAGLFFCSMTAYVLSRKTFRWANRFSFFIYFTTLFSGGLVPWYILCVQYLRFKQNPLLALVVPGLFSVWNILVLRNFMRSIPDAVVESAKMDGAGEFTIFTRLVLPLSKPALATIGLFLCLGYWNDWYSSFLFVDKVGYFSLQYYLYKMISSMEGIRRMASQSGNYISVANLPQESFKMAMTIIATGPILLLYPFLQKYFVKGITLGAVKG